MSTKTYGKDAIAELVKDDWNRLGSWHQLLEGGIYGIRPSSNDRSFATREEFAIRLSHPTKNFDEPALPFPFTASQFGAFCKSHPTFEWVCVESIYSNDDGSLDEEALEKLRVRNPAAEELVRLVLVGDAAVACDGSPSVRFETSKQRNDRVLLLILAELGIDPAQVPRETGGNPHRVSTKSKVLHLASTPQYAAQHVTASTIEKAWERIPKVDPPTSNPPMKYRK